MAAVVFQSPGHPLQQNGELPISSGLSEGLQTALEHVCNMFSERSWPNMKDPKVKLNTNGKYEYVSFSPESKIPSRESEQRTFEFLKQMWHDLFVMPSFTGSPKLPSHRTRHV